MAGIENFADALELVREHAALLAAPASETVALEHAAGRVLAAEICADRDQPPFDRSTRDGFAVRAAEWVSGTHLRVVGQVRAGEVWDGGEVEPGCAVEIMTGAPVPPGADAVVMVEHVRQSAGSVWRPGERELAAGENIVARGREAAAGEVVVAAGTVMLAAEIAEAASCGYARVVVRRRPVVAIAATGDELVGIEEMPEAHQIRNSNTFGIAALAEATGAEALRLKVAGDTKDSVRDRIAQGRSKDLLLLSGGVSAGKYDLVEEVLAEFGAEFLFTGVKMQPGKPLVFGRMPGEGREWVYFFGLPGNPVSTQVTFHCFVEPFLRCMTGAPWTGPRFVQGIIAEDVEGKSGLTRVLPARMTSGLEHTEVRMVSWYSSGDLAANARANCYAVLPDGRALRAGEPVTVLLR